MPREKPERLLAAETASKSSRSNWYLLLSGFFLPPFPPIAQACQTWYLEIQRLYTTSSCRTHQQARFIFLCCNQMSIWLERTSGRDLQTPAQRRVIASAKSDQLQFCLANSSNASRDGLPAAGLQFLPRRKFFPQYPNWASACGFYILLHHLPPLKRICLWEELGSVIFSSAFQEDEIYYYVVLLSPGRARALLLAPRMGHSSLRRSSTTSPWILEDTWHLSVVVTVFANKPLSIHASGCVQTEPRD